MSNNKYEFTGQTKQYEGRTVRRIRRLSDGQLGGWIESASNLNYEGTCWVADAAVVCDDARVTEGAQVGGHSVVRGNAVVRERAQVTGRSLLQDNALVRHHGRVQDGVLHSQAKVTDRAEVCGAKLLGPVHVTGQAKVTRLSLWHGFFGGHSVVGWQQDYWVLLAEYPVTYTRSDNSLQIGCQRATVAEWQARGWRASNGEYVERLADRLRLLFPESSPQPQPQPESPSQPQPESPSQPQPYKYELTGETQQFEGRTMRRIRRLSDGKLGGWIESERNLAQAGKCWVWGGAYVHGQARVTGAAQVQAGSVIAGTTFVRGSAAVCKSRVSGCADIGDAAVINESQLTNVRVSGQALVSKSVICCDPNHVLEFADRAQIVGATINNDTDWFYLGGYQWPATYVASTDSLKIGCQCDTVANWRARNWRGLHGECDPRLAQRLAQLFPDPAAPPVAAEPEPQPAPARRKYEFTGETKQYAGHRLGRIRRLADDELGGWIEDERNLSHEGRCWVADEALVFGEAHVGGDAQVCGQARVLGAAQVLGRAKVLDSAKVRGQAVVDDDVLVSGQAVVRDSVCLGQRLHVLGSCDLSGEGELQGHGELQHDLRLSPL